jgi:hypothetical protein
VHRRSQEVAAEKLCGLAAERDDLQALLLATLQRLEGVEAVVAAADATSAAMEDKVGREGGLTFNTAQHCPADSQKPCRETPLCAVAGVSAHMHSGMLGTVTPKLQDC